MASSLVTAFQRASIYSNKGADKGAEREGAGFRYEERVIALVFLRCLREGLTDFELTSDKHDVWDKFDDVVVTWRRNRDKYALLVQLKHKTGKEFEEVRKGHLLSSSEKNASDFNIRMYQQSYRNIKQSLRGTQYALMVSTNAPLHENALDFFYELETDSVLGGELMDAGGCLYELDPEKVSFDSDFIEHFFMFCGQNSAKKVRKGIKKELRQLLGSPRREEINSACDELCECVKKWKDRQCNNPENLTSSWSEWKVIRNRYKSS